MRTPELPRPGGPGWHLGTVPVRRGPIPRHHDPDTRKQAPQSMTKAGTFLRRNFEPLVLSIQVLIDLAVVVVACLLAWWLRENLVGSATLGPLAEAPPGGELSDSLKYATPLSDYREVFALTAAVCLVCFHTFGLYSRARACSTWRSTSR